RLTLSLELRKIPTPEFSPPRGIMAEPLPQLVRWPELLHPLIDGGRPLGQAARPEAVHENALAVAPYGFVVHALDLEHVAVHPHHPSPCAGSFGALSMQLPRSPRTPNRIEPTCRVLELETEKRTNHRPRR